MPDYLEESRIKKYRLAFPQYNNIPDTVFIEGIRRSEVPDADPDKFQKFFMETYGEPPETKGVFGTVGSGLAAGFGDVVSSTGGAVDWLTGHEGKSEITQWGENLSKDFGPDEDIGKSLTDEPSLLLSPKWWTYNVARLIPFIASSLIPAGGGASIGVKLFAGAKYAGAIGGGLAGGIYESLGEAGAVRNQAIEMGKTSEEADDVAKEVMNRNVFLNSIVQAIQVGKILKYTGTPITKDIVQKSMKSIVGDLGFESFTEGGQEGLQNIISNTALGLNPFDGLAESVVLGGAGGVLFGGGLEVIQKVNSNARKAIDKKLHPPPPTEPTGVQGGEIPAPSKGERFSVGATGITVDYQRGVAYANLMEQILKDDPRAGINMAQEMLNALTENGKDTQTIENLNWLKDAAGTEHMDEYYRAIAGLYGDAVAQGQVNKNTVDLVKSKIPKTYSEKLGKIVERGAGAAKPPSKKPAKSTAKEKVPSSTTPAAPSTIPVVPMGEEPMSAGTALALAFREQQKVVTGEEFKALSYQDKWDFLKSAYNMTEEMAGIARTHFIEATAKLLGISPEEYLTFSKILPTVTEEFEQGNVPTPGTVQSGIMYGPRKDQELEIAAVSSGTKPISIQYDNRGRDLAEKAGLTVRDLPNQQLAVFKDTPEGRSAYARLTEVLKEKPSEERIRKIGQILGYRENEIESFLGNEEFITSFNQIDALHGTGAEFEEFKPEFIGTGEGTTFEGRGFYFTKSPAAARFYAHQYIEMRRANVDEEEFGQFIKKINQIFAAEQLKNTDDSYLGNTFNDFPDIAGEIQNLGNVNNSLAKVENPSFYYNSGSYDGRAMVGVGLNEATGGHFDINVLQEWTASGKREGIDAWKAEILSHALRYGGIEGAIEHMKSEEGGYELTHGDEAHRYMLQYLRDHREEMRALYYKAKPATEAVRNGEIRFLKAVQNEINNENFIFPSKQQVEKKAFVYEVKLFKEIVNEENYPLLDWNHSNLDVTSRLPKKIMDFWEREVWPFIAQREADRRSIAALSEEEHQMYRSLFQDKVQANITDAPNALDGKGLYKALTLVLEGNENLTTQFLLQEIGIRGIQYKSGHGNDNFVIFDPKAISIEKKQEIYWQEKKRRGAIVFDNSGRTLYALENGDFSTFLHEVLFHIRTHDFLTNPAEILAWERYFGKRVAEFTNADWENAAQLFENWLAKNQTPPKGLEKVFQRIKQFMYEIYSNAKEYLGLEVAPNLEKIFNSWISQEGATGLRMSLAEELTNGNPLTSKRVIGSKEKVSESAVQDVESQFRSIGYQTVSLLGKDGKYEVIYYIRPSEQVQEAIQLRQRELRDEFTTLGEYTKAVRKLGRAFGYSTEAIRQQIEELKLANSDGYHNYYLGTTYTHAFQQPGEGKAKGKVINVSEIYKLVSEDANSVTLEEIAGSHFWWRREKGIDVKTVTIPKTELATRGFVETKNNKVRVTKSLPSGRTSKKATDTRRLAEAAEDVVPQTEMPPEPGTFGDESIPSPEDIDAANEEADIEIQDLIREDLAEKERVNPNLTEQEIRQALGEGVEGEESTLRANTRAQNIAARRQISRPDQAKVDALEVEKNTLIEQIRTLDPRKDKGKIAVLTAKYNKANDRQEALYGVSEGESQERPVTEDEIKNVPEVDPDQQIPPEISGDERKLSSGIITFLSPEARKDLYEKLQMSDRSGEMYSDDDLYDMMKNRGKDQVYEQRVVEEASTPFNFTADLANEILSNGQKAVDKGHSPIPSTSWLNKQLTALGLDGESVRYYRDKVFNWVGMPQTLARYNVAYFAKIFWGVDDGRKISASIANQLAYANQKWLQFKAKVDELKIPVMRVIYEGTMAKNPQVTLVQAPEKPWVGWEKMSDFKAYHTDEEVIVETGRRQKAREDYKEAYRQYKATLKKEKIRSYGRVYSPQELKDGVTTRWGFVKLTSDQIDDYYEIRRILDMASDNMKKGHIANGMPAQNAEELFSLLGYMPLSRGHGDWCFAYTDDSSSSKTKRGWARFKTKNEADVQWEAMRAAGKIKSTDPTHIVHRITDYTPSMISRHGLEPSDVVELIGEIGIPPSEIWKDSNLAAMMKAAKEKKGMLAQRTIRRGYVSLLPNTETFQDVIEEFVTKTSNNYAGAITRTKLYADLGVLKMKDATRSDVMWRKFADEYVTQAFSPIALHSDLWDGIRRAGFLWALAGNVSNAILNLTQPFVTVPAFLYDKNFGLQFGEVEKSFIEGIKSALYYNKYPKHGELPASLLAKYPRIKDAIDELRHSGVISAAYYENLVNSYGGKDKILAIAGILQSSTESHNRLTSVISGYVAAQEYMIGRAKGNEKVAQALTDIAGLSTQELEELALTVDVDKRMDVIEGRLNGLKNRLLNGTTTADDNHFIATRFARRTSDETNFVFGKHNLPYYVRSSGILQNPLKAGFLFRGFLFNYTGFLLTLAQSGRMTPMALASAIVPLVVLAGITGLPFEDDLKEALKTLGVVDVDTTLRKIIKNDTVSDLIIKGVPSILPDELAFDMSRRAGAGQVLPSGLTRGNVADAISDMFAGAPFSMSGRIMEGISDLYAGNTDMAFRKITPIGVGNIVKALQYEREGAQTARGNLLVKQEDVSSPATLAMTAMGFKSAKVAKAEDFEQALKYLTASRRNFIETFNSRMANAMMKFQRTGDNSEVQDVMEDIMQWNSKANSPAEFYRLRDQIRNIRRRIKLGTLSSVETTQVPRALRPEAYQLTQTYNIRR